MTDVLSDLLQHSLRIVLCGTAAGTTSAAERAYYAHRQNKFWKVLHAKRITARPGKENAPSTSPKTRTEVARLARYFADAGVPNQQFVDQAY